MSKQLKRVTAKEIGSKSVKSEPTTKPIIPEKYQDYFYIGVLIVSIYIFYAGAVFGGGFNVSDNIASESFKPYMEKATDAGEFPQWLPYIFCGLPGYSALLTSGDRFWDFIPEIVFTVTEFVGSVFGSDLARVLCFYAAYAIGMYFLMRYKKHERFVSFFTSFAATFSMGILIWVMIGHNTKPIVLSMFPYIIILLEKLREKFSLLYTVLLIFAVHFMMAGSHVQMIFYGFLAFGLYLLFELINRFITKQQPLNVLRAAVMLGVAAGVAFLMSSDRYLSTMEYTPYSTRGSAPLVQTNKSQDASGGNTYEYATMWSFSPAEVATFFVPNYFGFGQLKYEGPLTNGRELKMHTYWGQKEIEDAAPYMGIIVLGLAFVGFIANRKDVFVQFLLVLSLFALLLSFGKNLPIIYNLFYYFVPSFNKFRAPSMALALLQFAVPLLAGYGLTSVLRWRKNTSNGDKKLLNFILIFSGIFFIAGLIFSVVFKSAYFQAMASSDSIKQFSASYGADAADYLQEFIWSQMTSDWLITALIAVVSAALIYFYVKGSFKHTYLLPALFILLIFDLWRVGYRPMEYAERNDSWQKTAFAKTDVIDFLQQDKSIYRIADFASPSPNMSAYFHLENVGGYHSAKVRAYQDIMDIVENGSTSAITNPFLWNLLNVKYIITDRPLGEGIAPAFQSQVTRQFVYFNNNALPRAFFVKNAVVAKPLDILNSMKNQSFSPLDTMYIEKPLPVSIDEPDITAYARITGKSYHKLKLDVNSSGNNLLFLSEIYYPPAWRAFLDGKEVPVIKANYAFRAVIIPKGKHQLEFKFKSEKFELGKSISLITNIVAALAFIIGLILQRKKPAKNQDE